MPRDDDAAWRAIVDNYGERADLDEPGTTPAVRETDPETAARSVAEPLVEPHVEQGHDPSPDPWPEEHFVPPPAPPVPLAEPRRLLAWVGLFGSPTLVLVSLVAGVSLPSWLGLVLMVWFVAGFGFLVASMRPRPDDDGDDGAVV